MWKKMKDDDEVPKFYVHKMDEDDMYQLVSSILFILILHIWTKLEVIFPSKAFCIIFIYLLISFFIPGMYLVRPMAVRGMKFHWQGHLCSR